MPARCASATSSGASPPSGPTSRSSAPRGAGASAIDVFRGRRQHPARRRTRAVDGPTLERRLTVVHVGNAIAPALLARSDDDLPPVREALGAALAVRHARAARGQHRLDRRHTEFYRLAHRMVHRVVGRDALHQRHRERRLSFHRIEARRRARRHRACPHATSVAANSPPLPVNSVRRSPSARRSTRSAWCATAPGSVYSLPTASAASSAGTIRSAERLMPSRPAPVRRSRNGRGPTAAGSRSSRRSHSTPDWRGR